MLKFIEMRLPLSSTWSVVQLLVSRACCKERLGKIASPTVDCSCHADETLEGGGLSSPRAPGC